MPSRTTPPIRVAIIGGGPGGLASAIALSRLPDTQVTIYEQARELREVGAGINIGYNCWKVLELLDADEAVRGHVHGTIVHRNGLTGEDVSTSEKMESSPKYRAQRVLRTNLQRAQLAKMQPEQIKLRKRLTGLQNLEQGVSLAFEDGEEVVADLVVGGDGIRSVVRQHVFPDHAIRFTGRTIWRTIIPRRLIADIPEMTSSASWWHGPTGHFYNCLVDDPEVTPADEQMLEIATHSVVAPETILEKRFSWGVDVANEKVEGAFTDYDSRVRAALSRVPQGLWKEFSAFTGPRLENVTAWDKVVLIGDASHPLTGAFGSGAAFAMQDGYILARAVEHSRGSPLPLKQALGIFDQIKTPYYARMYDHLDSQAEKIQQAKLLHPDQIFEAALAARVKGFTEGDMSWIYKQDIGRVWQEFESRGVQQPAHLS